MLKNKKRRDLTVLKTRREAQACLKTRREAQACLKTRLNVEAVKEVAAGEELGSEGGENRLSSDET